MKMKRILLIIVLLIIGLSGVANTQSAWIVWKQMTGWSLSPPIMLWTMGEAYPTYDKCMDAVKTEVLALRLIFMEDPNTEITNYGEDWISIKFKSGSDEVTSKYKLYCYPDTIDPRK